ncbi:CHAT domain-containing protein [Kordia antarctica]|nr:CHAT domain-containing protein [Kordia antarctica]
MNSFEKLQELYKKGDYISFYTLYKALEKPLDDEVLLLAIKLARSASEWLDIEDILIQLKKSVNIQSVEKSKLCYEFYDFVRKKLNRKESEIILEKCFRVISNSTDSDLVFYAKKIQIKTRLILLHQGLLNAEEKRKVIEDGLNLYEKYKEINQCESLSFLEILVDYIGKHPIPDLKFGLEIIEKIIQDNSIKNYNKISFYLKKARFLLRTKYYLEIRNPIELPNEIKEILSFLEENKYLPATEIIESVYGNHLLDLELIEGIEFLENNILKLWQLGYHQEARNDYNNALRWMQDRGQGKLLKEFSQKINLPKKVNKTILEAELEMLHKSHDFHISGDYYNAGETLEKIISNIENETFQVLFIGTLVNNTSQRSIKNIKEIKIIDSKIKDLNEVGKTFLIAQLYAFMAMLDKKQSKKYFINSGKMYENLGMIQESLEQYQNYINQKLIEFNENKKLSTIDGVPKDLKKIISFFDADHWIKNRYSLQGNLCQVSGNLSLYIKQFEIAIESFEAASNLYLKANHLNSFALNTHRLGSIYLELGRKNQNINDYEKGNKVLSEGISISKKSKLNNFIWRLQFIYALTYIEPLARKLVSPNDVLLYVKNGEKCLDQIAFYLDGMIHKANQTNSSENLEATITFKDDTRQIISSGTHFFQSRGNYTKAIEWLEKMRTRSLLISMTNYKLNNDELKKHPLLLQENNIISHLYEENLNEFQEYSQNDLDKLYQKMLNDKITNEYAAIKRLTKLSITNLKESIRNNEKKLDGQKLFFLYYFIEKDNIYVYGISSQVEKILFSKVPIKTSDLEDYLSTFYLNINLSKTKDYNPGETFWTRFSDLIAPLKEWTQPDDIICIVPYGKLQNLPLHSLHIDGKPLIYRNPVFYNISLSTWQYIQFKNTIFSNFKSVGLFGNPEYNLENAEEEVLSLVRLFKKEALFGKNVTKKTFLKALKADDFIHFAGHGDLDKGHGFLSGLKLNDGVLTAKEIMNQRANTNFVTLASCDVGRQKNHSGEELVGLTSAFIASGVNTVMTGLWEVDDADAKEFFSIFYKKLLEGFPKVIAMQQAMLALMEISGKSHFCHWAMFSLTGDWR